MEKRETKYKIYLTCINRAIIALIGAAQYLDVSAPEDIIYNLILSIFGFLGFVYLLGTMIIFNKLIKKINFAKVNNKIKNLQ